MTAASAWGHLAVAIVFEVAGTAMLKLSDGLAKWPWFAGAIGAYAVSFALIALALRSIPLSVAYAVWGGAGAVLVVCIDVFLFGQSLGPVKLACIALIIMAVAALKMAP